MKTTPPEILAYIRTSTNEQGRKFSPASQRISTKVLAKQNGDKIGEWLEDHETATTTNRKKFQEICQRVMAGQVRKVYFCFVDRAFRNTEDALRTAREFAEKDCKLYFSDLPGIDLATPHGKMVFTQIASFGEFEHARIRQRSMENRERKMEDTGKPDSWNLVLGFRVVDGYPEIDPEKIEIAQALFELRDEGMSVYQIAGEFERRGWKPMRAKFFRASTLAFLLASEQYIGKYHRCDRDFLIQDRNGKLLQPIDPELFHRVRSKGDHIHRATVGCPSTQHLLSGFLWCPGPCEGRWRGWAKTDHGRLYRYYRCVRSAHRNPHIPPLCDRGSLLADPFEEGVFDPVWDYITDPERVRRGSEALQRDERAKLKGRDPREELEKLHRRIAVILDQEQRGDLAREESIEKIKGLRVKISKREIEARALAKVIEIAPLGDVDRTCRAIAAGGKPEGFEPRRLVLDGLQDFQVVMGEKEAVVTGALPVGAGGKNCTNRLAGTDNFFAPLPFEIKVKIRAA